MSNLTDNGRELTWGRLETNRPFPVRFRLYASRRTNKALCPCLVVQTRGISVIRILDPEHRQPYISLDSIFLLAGKSIPSGILELDLSRDAGDYDLTLAGLEPREALWVPLKLAREIADQLGLLNALSNLLDWDNRHIWSLDEGEAGLVHNWRSPHVDADTYSTGVLMQTEMRSISLLPKGQQVRTLLSQEQREAASKRVSTMMNTASSESSTSCNKYEQRLLRWSVLACEELLRSRKALKSRSEEDEEEHFNVESSDMVLLFDDYLRSLQIDPSFKAVSVDPEELIASKKAAELTRSFSKDDVYRRARINVILIHRLWTLYMSQIKSDDLTSTIPNMQAISKEPVEVDLKEQLKRIEASCKRSEWAVAGLLSRKATVSAQDSRSPLTLNWRLPYLGTIDSRLLLALIIGILLGSMTSRM